MVLEKTPPFFIFNFINICKSCKTSFSILQATLGITFPNYSGESVSQEHETSPET